MARLTPTQLYKLARDVGLSPSEAVVATAVALGESGGDPDAVGDTTITTSKWGPSVGLWQIRSLKAESGTGGTRDETKLRDPAFNARSMAAVYKEAGSKFTPWSVYTSGSWKQQMSKLDPAELVKADSSTLGGIGDTVIDAAGDAVGAVGDALNPLKVFEGWQDSLTKIALTVAVAGAGLWLVVAGVKAAAGGDE